MCRKAIHRNLVVLNSNALDLPFTSSMVDTVLFSFSIETAPEEVIWQIVAK